METIGIFGGSFNPVHIGHVMIASYLTQWKVVDKVWLTISPLNPFKVAADDLIPDVTRLAMLKVACSAAPDLQICDIELSMPKPSYTINTLKVLSKKYPRKRFKLIIGSDNWNSFSKWKDYEKILEDYGVIVYPRPGHPVQHKLVDGMELLSPPTINLSSTFVRSAIAKGRDMSCFLPQGVFEFIKTNNLYATKQ